MSPEQIIEKIDAILIEDFELEPDAVVPEASLREDLELDSLDAVDLVVALEKTFGIRVDGEVVKEMHTVGDIHAYVYKHYGSAEHSKAAGK